MQVEHDEEVRVLAAEVAAAVVLQRLHDVGLGVRVRAGCRHSATAGVEDDGARVRVKRECEAVEVGAKAVLARRPQPAVLDQRAEQVRIFVVFVYQLRKQTTRAVDRQCISAESIRIRAHFFIVAKPRCARII